MNLFLIKRNSMRIKKKKKMMMKMRRIIEHSTNQRQRSMMMKKTIKMKMKNQVQHWFLQHQTSLDEVALWVVMIGHLKKNDVLIIILFSSKILKGWWQIDWSTAQCKCNLETNIFTTAAFSDDDDAHRGRWNWSRRTTRKENH